MNICKQCGTQNPDNSTLCQTCGANLSAAPTPKALGSKRKLLIFGGIGGAVTIIAMVILLVILLSPTTIVLDDYFTVELTGYNGTGRASLKWDKDRMIQDMSEDLDFQELQQLKLLLFYARLDLDLEYRDDLMNGDTLQLELRVDEKAFKSLDLEIELKNPVYTVEGLEDPTPLNPFDYLEITYEGYAPEAHAILTNVAEDEFLSENLSFYFDGSYDLDEGSTFNVTVYFDEYEMDDQGYAVTETSREYTATGVPQPKEIDVFELLTVRFTGVNGSGQMSYEIAETEDPFLSNVHFWFDKTYNLSEGDTITCTASYYNALSYGYKVVSDEKTYTVPTLGKHVTDYASLSAEVQAQLMDAATKRMEEQFNASDISGYVHTGESIFSTSYRLADYQSASNFQITHAYTCSYTSWGTQYQEVGFVFRFDLAGNSIAEANTTVYGIAGFQNLVIKPDGTLEEGWEETLTALKSAFITYDLMYKDRLATRDSVNVTAF